MSTKAGKRPLRSLTAHEKLDAIRRVHDGESKASVARDIGVPESTLRGWCKNEDKISYLSRQSSPETDDSVHGINAIEPKEKKPKIDENLPFNLSLKPAHQRPSYSPNSDIKYVDYKPDNETPNSDKFALNLKTETTPKTSPPQMMTERERNRAELARLSVELGLNRPEMFMSNVNTGNTLADLSTNIGLLAQWNTLLIQQQQKPASKKVTAPADTSTNANTTYVKESKTPKLPKVDPPKSVEDSVWYWLKTQQAAMLALPQNQNPMPSSTTQNGIPTTNTSPTANGTGDQNSSWFWKWYKQFANAQPQQQPEQQPKPILYQQLTKDKDLNSENVQSEEKPKSTKARAVLDNLLLNNNNNVAVNKRDCEEEDLTQSEALEHGDKFLKWLECCGEPSVTAMQIMQFKSLLNNIKSSAERKNSDHNKTKVKRK